MNARLLLLAVLFAANTQAAIPKNTQVQYGAETATISYATAAWRTEVKGIEVYRCVSATLENCTPHLSLLPPTDHTIQVSGAGMWRLDFLKEINQNWYGSIRRSVKWSQYIAVLPTPTPAILQAAAKYAPKLSFSDAEGYHPVTIATLFDRPASSIGSKRLVPASDLAGVASTDTIAEIMRFNGHRENKLTLSKVAAAAIPGDSSNFPMYWFHQEDTEHIWITYFILFGFDKKHYSAAGDHALDRESLSIKLRKTGITLTPISVIYAGHLEDQPVSFRGCTDLACITAGTEVTTWTGGRTEVAWANAAKANDRPIAYVARGSHAMYPGFGWYGLSVSLWPDLTEAAGALTTKTLRSGNLTQVDMNEPSHSALTFSGYLIEGPIDWYRSFPFIRFPTNSWASGINQAFGNCIANASGCEKYVESIVATQIFSDNFDAAALDTTKWTVQAFNGNIATYAQSNGYLNISVPGGSCGFCGVSDGARFTPKVSALAEDFEVVVTAEEVERLSRDSTKPLSNLQLLLTGSSTELGIYITGDAINNQGISGHQIISYYRSGTTIVYPSTRSLTVGQYYAFQFRIRRVAGVSYLAYKIAQDSTWTEVTVPASFPATASLVPSIVVASGDGGGTRINSSFKVKFDSISISK